MALAHSCIRAIAIFLSILRMPRCPLYIFSNLARPAIVFFKACLSPVLFHENPKPEKRRGNDGQGRKRRSGEETAVRGGIKPRGGNNG